MISADSRPAFNQALEALRRGRGAEAAQFLTQALRSPSLRREDELAIRCALAEAWLLQDEVDQASAALGRPPDLLREKIEPSRLSALWRLHGRIASARGDQSRAIALLGRALKQAELAHDPLAIGLAHYELGICYKHIGDPTIIRQHVNGAASALHAAGDRRYLALVHSLSGTILAQGGRYDEAMGAFRQAEHLATLAGADDVVALVCGNQANVALMQHRLEQARTLAERSVALHESCGASHGLAVVLATLGQICVRQGDLPLAEHILNRALSVRTPVQYHETSGAVFDSLAQINLVRRNYEQAEEYLRLAADAYGKFGLQAARWYEWNVRLLTARLAVRRGNLLEGLQLADQILQAPGVPPADALQADLIAAEALLSSNRLEEAAERLSRAEARLDRRATPGAWGEYLRLRAEAHRRSGRPIEAYHALAQSVSVFSTLGERHQLGLSHLALARLLASQGARSMAARHAREARLVFDALGAATDLRDAQEVAATIPTGATGEYLGGGMDADDVVVARLVEAAVLPDLLATEAASSMQEAVGGDCAVVFVQAADDVRLLGCSGCDVESAMALARSALNRPGRLDGNLFVEAMGRDAAGPRFGAVSVSRPLGQQALRRLRMIAVVVSQGFQLCGMRDQPAAAPEPPERPLEALLPGFVCVSAAMSRVAAQIQQLQGSDLTVLVTGESGTGKDLVARAIHLGSSRSRSVFLPFNCTTTTRELADSQLFGHRRGSFTGAVSDSSGIVRSAHGGTLFLDEVGDLPVEVQPKFLRFLEQGEIMPVGETRPAQVDVRVIAATNADLEQRVAEGRFREDLYYRLSVIRIHVPPLRDRREAIPHLSALFLREVSDRLGKPDVQLSKETLDLFSEYWWPGNVRQLKNEIQRAVMMAPPGGIVRPEHLTREISLAPDRLSAVPSARTSHTSSPVTVPVSPRRIVVGNLGEAVEKLEREMIRQALEESSGNISETARVLGLTRRGLYLKLKRLGFESAGSDGQESG
ncbi:MAG: sigma 54-interacting transcriptional regulator [Vicinamibacterales bacterium]